MRKSAPDFDPAIVARDRLVGYENRDIADRDFRNDEIELTEQGKASRAPFSGVRIRPKPPGRRAGDRGRGPAAWRLQRIVRRRPG